MVARYADYDNCLLAYHDGTNAVLVQRLAASASTLITGAATYAASAALRLWTDGQSARLYYNNALVGTTSSIDATLTNVKCGLYSTNVANTLDNFVAYETGTNGEYSNLTTYSDLASTGVTLGTSPQVVTITNDGDATVLGAVVTVTAGSADITALEIESDSGAHLTYDGTIEDGEALVVDCGALSVKNDGSSAYADFALGANHTARYWLPLPTGDTDLTVTWTGGGTGSTIKVEFYDAWH
jgi:hypothetical protein